MGRFWSLRGGVGVSRGGIGGASEEVRCDLGGRWWLGWELGRGMEIELNQRQ